MRGSKLNVSPLQETEISLPGTEELRELYGEPRELVREAWAPRLDEASRRWLEATTMILLSSLNNKGNLDITPRGGKPGFIVIRDDQNIAFLDERGNNKIHTLSNLVQNPEVGMMFVIPGLGEVLRAYGRARVHLDGDLIQSVGGDTNRNRSVISIELQRVFPHCSKAFNRAGLWDAEAWTDRDSSGVPTLSELAREMAATRSGDS